MKGCVYYMTCADMAHLIKIGYSASERFRLREANSQDTFKPPSGFRYGCVIHVANMQQVELWLHRRFAHCRRTNVHGNKTEFFEIDEESVRIAFSEIDGERVDLTTLDPLAESIEAARIRELLHFAVNSCSPCKYKMENPKCSGSKCYLRYEQYKVATTMDQALRLGTFEDIVFDYNSNFLTIQFLSRPDISDKAVRSRKQIAGYAKLFNISLCPSMWI